MCGRAQRTGGNERRTGESRRSLSGRIASKRKERGSVGLKAKSGVEKRIRGMKREGDRAERKASEHASGASAGGRGGFSPTPGSPGQWSHNEGLFEFAFEWRLEKQFPIGYFY